MKISIFFGIVLWCSNVWAESEEREPAKLGDEHYTCFDHLDNCEELALNGHCHGFHLEEIKLTIKTANLSKIAEKKMDLYFHSTYIRMASYCFQTCKRIVDFSDPVFEFPFMNMIGKILGEYNETIYDYCGYKHNICDLRDEFTAVERSRMMGDRFTCGLMSHEGAKFPRKFTELGFEKTKVPKDLFEYIKAMHTGAVYEDIFQPEFCEAGSMRCHDYTVDDEDEECKKKVNPSSKIFHLPNWLYDRIGETLLPLAEQWAGIKLLFNNNYGIRRYVNGGRMFCHVDKSETHIISAIINVAQDVKQPWPLDLIDFNGNYHHIEMEPGDLVWYESARLPHGRVSQLNGTYYDNIFVHYKPTWYQNKTFSDIVKVGDSREFEEKLDIQLHKLN